MAEQDLDIVIRVRGGQVASSEIKGVAQATKQVGTETAATTSKTSKLGSSLKGLATGFAVYKGYQWIKGATNQTTQLAKATAGLQRITGMDTQTSAGWVMLAKERGIQSKQLNQGFITLAKNISSASQGSKASSQAFQQLGLNAAALKQQSPVVQMSMLADSFAALPAGVDKAALAQKLFGRQAQTLLPILAKGGKALSDQVAELGKQSGMNRQSMKSTMSLVASQRQLHAATTGLQVAIGTALIPILQTAAQVIAPIATAFSKMMQGSQAFRTAVVALSAALTTYIAVTKLAAAANITLEASVAPIAAIVVGLGFAFVMLYQKCAWFRNAVQAAMRGVVAGVNWVKQAAINTFNWVKANWPLLLGILTGPIGLAVGEMIKHWSSVKTAAQSVWNFLRGLGNFIGGVFTGAWNTATGAIKSVASAIKSVVDTASKISSLPGKALGVLGKIPGVGSIFHGQAGGVAPSAGAITLVGERGPEIVALPGGAAVYPTGMAPAGLGGPAVIHTHVWIGEREVAHAVGNYTAGRQASR